VLRTGRAIAGWPARLESEWICGREIRIYSPSDLEERLDRHQLLHDDGYVPPYWALLWSGSRELARHLAASADLAGRTALDVGCGLGLLALAAARSGARVTAIDREPAAIEFLRASAAANALEIEAMVGDPSVLGERRFDAVMAAEILYEREAFRDLARALVRLTVSGGMLWIADAGRVDTRAFFAEIASAGVLAIADETAEVREEGSRIRVRIVGYRIPVTR
jgi:predicted nicotinamide N-methyase